MIQVLSGEVVYPMVKATKADVVAGLATSEMVQDETEICKPAIKLGGAIVKRSANSFRTAAKEARLMGIYARESSILTLMAEQARELTLANVEAHKDDKDADGNLIHEMQNLNPTNGMGQYVNRLVHYNKPSTGRTYKAERKATPIAAQDVEQIDLNLNLDRKVA